MTLNLTLTFPDALAALAQSPELPRRMLEAFAVEGYRDGTLSKKDVSLMLEHGSRWETEDFLAARGAWPGLVAAEVAKDGSRLNALLSR